MWWEHINNNPTAARTWGLCRVVTDSPLWPGHGTEAPLQWGGAARQGVVNKHRVISASVITTGELPTCRQAVFMLLSSRKLVVNTTDYSTTRLPALASWQWSVLEWLLISNTPMYVTQFYLNNIFFSNLKVDDGTDFRWASLPDSFPVCYWREIIMQCIHTKFMS